MLHQGRGEQLVAGKQAERLEELAVKMARCTHVVQRHAGGEVEVDLLEEGGAAAVQIALLVGVARGMSFIILELRERYLQYRALVYRRICG